MSCEYVSTCLFGSFDLVFTAASNWVRTDAEWDRLPYSISLWSISFATSPYNFKVEIVFAHFNSNTFVQIICKLCLTVLQLNSTIQLQKNYSLVQNSWRLRSYLKWKIIFQPLVLLEACESGWLDLWHAVMLPFPIGFIMISVCCLITADKKCGFFRCSHSALRWWANIPLRSPSIPSCSFPFHADTLTGSIQIVTNSSSNSLFFFLEVLLYHIIWETTSYNNILQINLNAFSGMLPIWPRFDGQYRLNDSVTHAPNTYSNNGSFSDIPLLETYLAFSKFLLIL